MRRLISIAMQRDKPPAVQRTRTVRPIPTVLLACLIPLLSGCIGDRKSHFADPNTTKFRLSLTPLPDDPDARVLSLTGGPDSFWRELHAAKQPNARVAELTLRLVDPATGEPSPHKILGVRRLERRRLLFVPSFPLSRETGYHAEFFGRWPNGSGESSIRMTKGVSFNLGRKAPRPSIVAIHPSASHLPANQLKFYLRFSSPMKQGDVFKHLNLLDETTGTEVPEPFRKLELWSPDGKRFTLWIHPGRQKTGVNLNEEIGPVLRAGHRYSLIVSGNWESAEGVPLGREIRKRFRSTAAIHTRIDVSTWTLKTPSAGTRAPIRIRFPAPLDWALLQERLKVIGPTGKTIEGIVTTSSGETNWTFTPKPNWTAGEYQLEIDTVLEDLAGNNLRQPFEVDLAEPRGDIADVQRIPFSVR